HRTARVRHRLLPGARDDVARLLRVAQLVVPFHALAHHRRLVEHLLRPVDEAAARAELARFGRGRAARRVKDRHVVARGVDDAVDAVRGADVDVHHDRLRAPGRVVVAVRHADGDVLVRHDERTRDARAALGAAREAFHDRGEIGARVREQVVDAVRAETLEIDFRGAADRRRPGIGGAARETAVAGGTQDRLLFEPRIIARLRAAPGPAPGPARSAG